MNRSQILGQGRVIKPSDPVGTPTQLVQLTLTPDQYRRLEDQFPPRLATDPVVAAQLLGQQQVLSALRRGFVQGA